VQRLLTEESLARGRRIVGHKIGLTSCAVQQQLGVDQPDSGALFADMRVATGAIVATGKLLQPKIEAEIAFILADDLDGDLSESRLRAAAGIALPAIEIVDSRVRDWSISIVDTVADRAAHRQGARLGYGRLRLPDDVAHGRSGRAGPIGEAELGGLALPRQRREFEVLRQGLPGRQQSCICGVKVGVGGHGVNLLDAKHFRGHAYQFACPLSALCHRRGKFGQFSHLGTAEMLTFTAD
jgi:hypothetical protein